MVATLIKPSGHFREPQMPRINEAWWRERGEEGVLYYIRAERSLKAQEGPPRQGDPGDPLCCGGYAFTYPVCVCVFFEGMSKNIRTRLSNFLLHHCTNRFHD